MSWRSESLLFKLFITPSSLSVAQKHCTMLVVRIAIRNLSFHLCLFLLSSPEFPSTHVPEGELSLLVAPKADHYSMAVGGGNGWHNWGSQLLHMFPHIHLHKNSTEDDLFWNQESHQHRLMDSFITTQNYWTPTTHLLYSLLLECIWRDTQRSHFYQGIHWPSLLVGKHSLSHLGPITN